MTQVIWKEFPKINRKVAFQSNRQASVLGLGCHCGSISSVYASFGSGYYGANNGKNIEILDKGLEKPIAFRKDTYGSTYVASAEEYKKITDHFKEIDLKASDFSEDLYKGLIEGCATTPLWVLSDVINWGTPVRAPLPGPSTEYLYQAYGNTGNFVKYLIEGRIGYVLASPIIQNPNHRSGSNYSLNQGWFWIPPNHLERAIDVSEAFGGDQFPSKEAWAEIISKDLCYLPEKIPGIVLAGGVFPETGLFKPGRGDDGRFIAKVKEKVFAAKEA